MAGDWIKFEIATPDKPEVWQIAEALSIDPDAVVGKLLRVWSWFDQQTENGNAPSVSKLLLDRLVGVSGFCKVVIACGWMSDDGTILTLPNFDLHNGKTAKNRAQTAKRVALHKSKGNANGNDSLTLSALPKEEKRREDNIKDNDKSLSRDITPEYPDWFEYIWSVYPERSGGDNKKIAYQKANARRKSGFTTTQLLEAVNRYKLFVIATGNIGTTFTKQAATFFGSKDNIENPWITPANPQGQNHGQQKFTSPVERMAHEKRQRDEEQLSFERSYPGFLAGDDGAIRGSVDPSIRGGDGHNRPVAGDPQGNNA